jgi:hypothetical protein
MVRIRFPPAASLQTLGPSAQQHVIRRVVECRCGGGTYLLGTRIPGEQRAAVPGILGHEHIDIDGTRALQGTPSTASRLRCWACDQHRSAGAFTEVTIDFFERHGAFIISRTATVIHP